MSDHPDIEKLDPTIDGLQVREVIRALFRFTENGTPDAISKVGCLALAKKSNQMGGGLKGHVIWNAWREAFPVKHHPATNTVDFFGQDFRQKQIDFSRFVFGDGACFTKTQWGTRALFRGAQWGERSHFGDATWGIWADFQDAKWGNRCFFSGAQWLGDCYFQGAQWGDRADFSFAQWGDGVNFQNAIWGNRANFIGAKWASSANFKDTTWGDFANFKGAQWGSQTNFQGALFGNQVCFQGEKTSRFQGMYRENPDLEHLMTKRNLHPSVFNEVDFSGASFLGQVDFSNRQFKGQTNFGLLPSNVKRGTVKRDSSNQVVLDQNGFVAFENTQEQRRHASFAAAPIFHGCELHQDTSFEGAKFPGPTGSEGAARAYRTLKLAFSDQQAIHEEQRFFRLEMEEERLLKTGFERLLLEAYKTLSDYGFSVARPMVYLAFLPLAWMILGYACLSLFQLVPSGVFLHKMPESTWLVQILNFSLTSALPTPGIDLAGELRPELFGKGGIASIALAIEMLQKILSLAGFFLTGLALRNLFKLKQHH